MGSSPGGLILIIDPDPLEWTPTQRLLDCQGYDLGRARDLASAYQWARQFPLGLILCHERVDRYLGPELVQQILQNQRTARPAVMFISKNQAPGVILRNHPFGPAMHLSGSIGPSVLLELVERRLGMPHHLPAVRSCRALPGPSTRATPPFSSQYPPMVAPR